MSEPSSDVNPLDALAEEFVARWRRGERPPLDEFIARRPDLADDIRDLFPGLVVMEGVRPEPGDVTGPFEGATAVPALRRLGDYRIIRVVGRGGMGVVYEAEQESLGRHVALKVLPAHALLEAQRLRRFQREAKAAARLHHTNIVPVYGVGEADGVHYYAMQFIQGLGLDQVLAELRKLRRAPAVEDAASPSRDTASAASAAQSLLTGRFDVTAPPDLDAPPDSGGSSSVRLPGQAEGTLPSRSGREYWRSAARVGVQVAEALAYAHAQGVLHRDVKPSNLLLDTRGNVWVTDFGLAKAADGEDLTHTGDIVGTLRYMAPECFSGKADARSDVYSLGLTLYELLTLRPAFVGKDGGQLLQQVLHGDQPRPRLVRPDVPRDLETVVLKAIARDPAHRYASAAELADDLRRFVDDRPIQARRISRLEHAWRWCRRNPVVAQLAAALLLVLVVAAAGSSLAAYRFQRLAESESLARQDAVNKGQEIRDGFDRLDRANAFSESARLRADAGHWDEALTAYTAAAEERPDLAFVWLDRGAFYLKLYRWEEADADLAKGFQLHTPADPWLWHCHAALRLYVGDGDAYRRVCREMLQRFGQTTDARTADLLARTCALDADAIDDWTQVVRLMEKAAADNPEAAPYTSDLAGVLLRSGRPDAAVQRCEAFKQRGQGDIGSRRLGDVGVFGRLVLALAYRGLGNPGKANAYLSEANNLLDSQIDFLTTYDPSHYGVEASRLFRLPEDDYNPAVCVLRHEVQRRLLQIPGPEQAPIHWVARSMGRAVLKEWGPARAEAERAIAARPNDYELRLLRGNLYAGQERWAQAAEDFGEAIRRQPGDWRVWYERGRMYSRQERWAEAAADFDRAMQQPDYPKNAEGEFWQRYPCDELVNQEAVFVELTRRRPRDVKLWAEQARYLSLRGKAADAIAAYDKAIEIEPENPSFLYKRAFLHQQESQWDAAASDYVRVLEVTSRRPELGFLEAWAHESLARNGELLTRALELCAQDPFLAYQGGWCFSQKGRWDKAAALLKTAYKPREPGDSFAWAQLLAATAAAGNRDDFRAAARRMFELYGTSDDANDAERVALFGQLLPGALDDTKACLRQAEKAYAADARPPWRLSALALAQYRDGQFEPIVPAVKKYLETFPANYGEHDRAILFLVLGLAQHRLGQDDDARLSVAEAAKRIDRVLPLANGGIADAPLDVWWGWACCRALRAEAEAALEEPAPKP